MLRIRWFAIAVLAVLNGCTGGKVLRPSLTPGADSTGPPYVIGQGVVVTNDGVVIGDDELLEGGQLEEFLKHMKPNFDAVELRLWTDFEVPDPDAAAVVRDFIDRAHERGVAVYLNYWQYPGTKETPENCRAVRFDENGELVQAQWDDDHVHVNHVDKSSPDALAWFADQLGSRLRDFGPFDGFLIVEDKVASWQQQDSWPQRVRYWSSPTYSPSARASFQTYLSRQGRPARLFPVDRPELVRTGLTELVFSAPADPLWIDWYEWRFEVFTNYLTTIRNAVQSVRDVPVMYMPWQRVVEEADAAYQDDWPNERWDAGFGFGIRENAIFGVSARAIGAAAATDAFILEYGEDGTHVHWPMEANRINTDRVAAALKGSTVAFGSFVQFFNYSDHRHIKPEWIAEELAMGQANNAQVVVAYDVATVFPGSGRYNEEIAAYWRQVRASKFRRMGQDLISEVQTKIGGRKTLETAPERNGLRLEPPPGYELPSMPEGVGSFFDKFDLVYVSAEALNGPPPYFVVKDNWDNPRCAPDDRFDDSTLSRGYIRIRRQDLTLSSFQVVSRSGEDVLWAVIAETPGFCGKLGVKCRPSSWLFKPVPWTKVEWAGLGWSPDSAAASSAPQ